MHVEIFTVCNSATIRGSHLDLTGCMESVCASEFPTQIPACAVAIRIRFENQEAGRHMLELGLSDADGTLLLPSVRVDIEFQAKGTAQHSHIHVAEFENLLLPAPGEYSFDLRVNDRIVSQIPFFAELQT